MEISNNFLNKLENKIKRMEKSKKFLIASAIEMNYNSDIIYSVLKFIGKIRIEINYSEYYK